MTVKSAKSGEIYDLGAEADEVNLELEIMGKEKLLEPLLEKMYEIGFNEGVKLGDGWTDRLMEDDVLMEEQR